MAVRGAVQPVNGLGGNVHRRGIAERGVGHGHVVVNGLGQGDDVEAGLMQAQRIFLRAAAAEADDGVETPLVVILHDGLGHVLGAAVNDLRCGWSRLVPRMVPPMVRMPESVERSSLSRRFSTRPRKPSRKPMISMPWWPRQVLPTPRMAALRPGLSPPAVRMPMRLVFGDFAMPGLI